MSSGYQGARVVCSHTTDHLFSTTQIMSTPNTGCNARQHIAGEVYNYVCIDFLTNQLVKEFWNSVHICQSYYQTSSGSLFWDTL